MYRGAETPPQPSTYDVRRTGADRMTLLGGHADAWAAAMSVAWGPSAYRTAFRALWRDDALLARFDVRDERPWHTRVDRDGCLWEEEVVEIFLDPTCSGTDYAELEISPANVVCDLHVARLAPERDVRLEWNFETLETVVHPGERADDWMAIACLPFGDFASLSPRVAACLPVEAGDTWHFNVFRIKRPHGPAAPELGAVYAAWSVPDGTTFHTPGAFRPMRFTEG